MSIDPVTADGNTGSNFNRYWYANNNPYKFTDPDGRQARNGRGNPNPSFAGLTTKQKIEVVRIVARSHQIDMSGVQVNVHPGGAGAMIRTDGVHIWDGQFATRSRLAATIGHEIELHLDTQIVERGEGYEQTPESEVEAFNYNIQNAQRFGNTPEEVAEFTRTRDGWLRQVKKPEP